MSCLFVIRFIIYKAPGEIIRGTGTRTYKKEMKYFYTDSASRVSHMLPGASGYKNLNDPSGALANTLRPVLKKIRNMVRIFGSVMVCYQNIRFNAQAGNLTLSTGSCADLKF